MKKQVSQTLIRIGLILGILVVLNFISVRLFGRLDLTSQGVYTLSDASKKLVGSLDVAIGRFRVHIIGYQNHH